jgi:predicted O-methyltransferase YrrM
MGVYQGIALTAEQQGWEIKYNIVHEMCPQREHALSMRKSHNPISIKEMEWEYLRDFCCRHQLSRGYELATGVGLSSIAAGLGMKEAGVKDARLVTMDAYIEENRPSSLDYATDAPQCYTDADGFKSVRQLIRYFELDKIVTPTVGWSPNDTVSCLSTAFDLSTETLDYVFIDGQHYLDCVIADLQAVLPYIQRERYAIFLHDTHAGTFEPTLSQWLTANWGKSYTVCPGCSVAEGGYNLSAITDLGL